jgi:MerR family transcriptional regulator/heat shock protein HspR
MLREIQRLSQADGVNLAGIKRIISLEQYAVELQQRVLELEAELADAQRQVVELTSMISYGRRDLVPTRDTSTALVVWRPRRPGEAS